MGKIIFVNRYFYPDHSATSQLLSDLAFDLARQGSTVEVIASRQLYDDSTAALPSKDNIEGVLVRRARTTSFGRGNLFGRAVDYITFYISATYLMMRTVRSGNILVVKTDPPLLSPFAAVVAKLRGAKLINWVQDIFPEVAAVLGVKVLPPVIKPLVVWLRNLSWRFAWRNVVLGDRMEEYLLDQGVERDRVRVIHNWSDGTSVSQVARGLNPLRKEWDLGDKFVVGYSGNLGRAHEFLTIIDAAALLSEEKGIVFLFIGGGAQIESVKSAVIERGLDNVIFRPYQPRAKLAESLSVSDLHIISLWPELEGFIVPSKFYGIAAVGRPTLYVGDTDGEVPRLLKKEGCGAAVSVGDAEGFAGYVKALAMNPTGCHQMGINARELFDRCFDKPIAVKAWEQMIQAEIL